MTRSRMILVAILAACALASSLFAAGTQEQSQGVVKLRFMTTEDWSAPANPVMASRARFYEGFKQKYPNIEIQMELVPWEQIYSQVIVADEAGAAPDIFWMGARASYEVLAGGRAMPLNDFLSAEDTKDFKGPVFQMAEEGGKYHLVPMTTDTRMLFYRKELFKEVGLNPDSPPRKWADVFQHAQKLNNPPNRWGYGIIGGKTLHAPHLWMTNLWMGGGDLIDANKKAVYGSPAGVAAGQYYADLVHKYKVAPKEAVSVMYPDMERGFIGGNYAMAVLGGWSYSTFAGAIGEEAFGITRLPIPEGGKDATFSGGWGFMISSSTKHAKDAWNFISHMSSREALLDVGLLLNQMPTRTSVVNEPRIKNTYIGVMAAYAIDAAHYNPKLVNNGPFFDGMNQALQEILQGTRSPQQALTDAVKAYNAKY